MFSEREMSLLQAQSILQSASIITTTPVILQALCKLPMQTGALTLYLNSESLLILHLVYLFMFYLMMLCNTSDYVSSNTSTG
jgi:hypothetical protein